MVKCCTKLKKEKGHKNKKRRTKVVFFIFEFMYKGVKSTDV